MKKLDKSLIEFCQDLLRTRSYSGDEQGVAKKIQTKALRLGYDETWIDGLGNVICKIKGNGNKKILFDGHMDTVPVSEEKWAKSPFGGEIIDGKIYGRGASDMKCSLAAMIYGAAALIPTKEQLAGDIYVSGTVCEEQFEGIAFGKVIEQVLPDYVVIGEASGMQLNIGQRGRAEIIVETFGKSAHSSNPQAGYNAVYAMSEFIQRLRKSSPPNHNFLGDGISELTDITSAPYPGVSVVPYYSRATIDRRLLVNETKESVLSLYEELCQELTETDEKLKIEFSIAHGKATTYTGKAIAGERFFPAWLMKENSEIVQIAKEALKEAGTEPIISKYSFCTNGSMSAGIKGIPTIGFGPGLERLAHIDDEYIKIDELLLAAKVYSALSKRFLRTE